MTSVIVIATGQLLLGNTLAAVTTVASAAVLSNPIAMTCAALGAIYYGWNALNDRERNDILERLGAGLAVGVELIRSMVDFVIRTAKAILTSKQLQEFKEFVKSQAALFGKSLYDITRKVGDLVKGTVEKAGQLADQALTATGEAARDAADAVSEAAGQAASATKEAAERLAKAASDAKDAATRVFSRTSNGESPTDRPPSPPSQD